MDELTSIIRLFHPVPPQQDANCPFIEWMGEDLAHCPGIGEYACTKRVYYHGEYNQNKDFHPCNQNNHEACDTYQTHKEP